MLGRAGQSLPGFLIDWSASLSAQLILFDVDGTLIATNYTGRWVMSHALREVFGTDGALDSISFAGKTDLGIITSVMAGAGLSAEEISLGLPSVYESMTRHGGVRFFGDNLVPCSGVTTLLETLRTMPRITLGLQTGNVRETALLKLTAAGLDPSWFTVNAFGSDSSAREGLLPVAWRRAMKLTDTSFSGHNTIVVGDTPGDIKSARANGARSLGVASGFCSYSELAEARPDHLLSDLTDTDFVISILTSSDYP